MCMTLVVPQFCSLAAAVSHTCKTHFCRCYQNNISKKNYEFNTIMNTQNHKTSHTHTNITLTLLVENSIVMII